MAQSVNLTCRRLWVLWGDMDASKNAGIFIEPVVKEPIIIGGCQSRCKLELHLHETKRIQTSQNSIFDRVHIEHLLPKKVVTGPWRGTRRWKRIGPVETMASPESKRCNGCRPRLTFN